MVRFEKPRRGGTSVLMENFSKSCSKSKLKILLKIREGKLLFGSLRSKSKLKILQKILTKIPSPASVPIRVRDSASSAE